jgi:tetratricopeptide (TPR) repeat protein
MLGVVVVGGYFLALLFWPFGLVNPVGNPLQALTEFSNFSVSIRQLFEGVNTPSNELPWYYLPKYILITNPIFALLGVALFAGLVYKFKDKFNPMLLFMVVFAAIFPIAYILYKGSNVYGGWRQVLFIYPPLVVLAAIGWNELISMVSKKQAKMAVLAVFAVLAILPFQWMIRNTPFQTVYFNYAFGGVNAAYGEYETDYYLNSLRHGALWLIENKKAELSQTDSLVLVCTDNPSLIRYLFEDVGDSIRVAYNKFHTHQFLEKGWDYAVYTSSYFDGLELRKGLWPPAGTIHEVTADGVPLTVVVEQVSYEGQEGVRALNSGNVQLAINKLQAYIQAAPSCYYAYDKLGEAYLRAGQAQQAVDAFNKSLGIYENNVFALSYLFYVSVSMNDGSNADFYAQQISNIYTMQKDRMRLLQHYGQTANKSGEAGMNNLAQSYANKYNQLLGELQADGRIEN